MNQLKLTSTGLSINNENIAAESFNYRESICSNDVLRFGSCEVSVIKVRIRHTNPVIGRKFNVQLGSRLWKNRTCYVDNRTADRCYRDIELYDALYEVMSSDVSTWYNSVFPTNESTVTLKNLRDSFFNNFDIAQEAATLPNDSIIISKTVDPEQITGKTVLNAICEMNGCFGRINDSGKFEYIFLSNVSPKTISSDDMVNGSAEYADYVTEYIDKIQIRQEENDIGASYGSGNNCYVIQGNFLLYGKDEAELVSVASNLYGVISTVSYRPFNMKKDSDLSLNVGECVVFQTNGIQITSYVLEHEIKGIQSLTEIIQARGTAKQPEKTNTLSDSIIQLKGKSNVLERSIEQTRSIITDVEQGLQTQITQNASSISAEITRATGAETGLSNRISATESKFSVKIEEIQKEIDGEIVTYNVPYVPTLLNYPAWDFTYNIPCDGTVACTDVPMIYNDEYYSRNARSVAFNVVTSMSYRFTKGENGEWYWRDIGDTDFGIAMQKISELEITTDSISATVEQNQIYNNQQISSMSSRITQTAESITSEVNRATQAEGSLSSRITQNADAINLRVQKGSIISEINQTAESVTIKANRIDLVGLVNATEFTSKYATIESLNATNVAVSGKASVNELNALSLTVNGKASVSDLNAVSARVGNLEVAGYITAKDVNGNVTSISGSAITTGKISADRLDINTIQSSINRLGSVTAGSINSEYTTLHDSFYLWNGNKKYKISVKYNVSLGYYLSATWENV